MPTIDDIRKQSGDAYKDMSDEELAGRLYQKHYSDMPQEQFYSKLGMKPPEEPSTLGDMATSFGRGISKGTIGLAGLPGDIAYGLNKGIDYLTGAAPPASGAPALADIGTSAQMTRGVESVAGKFQEPKTTAGRFAQSVGEFLPSAAIGPGGLASKAATTLAGGLGAEAGGELGEAFGETGGKVGRFIGGFGGGLAAGGGAAGARNLANPLSRTSKDLNRALVRDGDTMDSITQRLQEARRVRPNATLADVGGENVRGVVERVAQTPGAGRTTVIPTLTGRQQQQMGRLFGDLTSLTGTRRTALQATQETMSSRAAAATPLYERAYEDGDFPVWSDGLERLSASPTVQGAMHGAVKVWQDEAIADGYGAMNPGAMVSRGGNLEFLHGKVPVFPNIQFWDYTKRILDDQVQVAIRAGQNQKARTLTRLTQMLREQLDEQVPTYQAAREAWGGQTQYMNAIEEGGAILDRNLTAEQLHANLAEMSDAQREGYVIGAVGAIRGKMGNDPGKMADMTKYLRSPEMREKIAALMPNEQAAERWQQGLEYEIKSSELTGRALGGPATARRIAEKEDAENIIGDLVMDAMTHGATGGIWRAALGLPKRVGDTLRSRSDARTADVLVRPQPLQRVQQVLSAPRGGRGSVAVPAAVRAGAATGGDQRNITVRGVGPGAAAAGYPQSPAEVLDNPSGIPVQ